MFDLNVPKLEKLIGERFTGKDPSVLNNALAAFHAGYAIRRATCWRPSSFR
jgi:2-oxoglutarate/2-oxoacid ferredoxin oxidoreductase subunit alpha